MASGDELDFRAGTLKGIFIMNDTVQIKVFNLEPPNTEMRNLDTFKNKPTV